MATEQRISYEDAIRALRAEYYEDVDGIADEAIRIYKEEGGDLNEMVSEMVDGNEWVIYTGRSMLVNLLTESDEMRTEYGDEMLVKDGDVNWSGIAYLQMEADVNEEIARRVRLGDFDPDETEEDN